MIALPTSKFVRNTCLFFLLTLSFLFNPYNVNASRTVRVGVYDAKPLAYYDNNGAAHGFFVDMLNHIAEKEQWNVKYVPGTWQEGLDRLKDDKIDLVLCIAYTDVRDKYMDFPKEYLLLDWGLVFKKKGTHITSLLDLEGKTVSVLKGDVYSIGFQELVRQFNINVKLREVEQPSDVFKAVDSGAVEAGVNGNLYGILNDTGRRVEQTPIIFTPVKLGYAVNEGKNGDLIAALDRNISELKGDKTSAYHHDLKHLTGNEAARIPQNVYWGAGGIAAALILVIAWNVMLKRQVKSKTVHLMSEIKERELAENELRESKAKFQAFYDLGLVGLTITSPEKGWININDCLCNMLGYTEAELRMMTWEQLTHPDDLAADVEQFGRVLDGQIDGYELEKRFLKRSGGVIFTKLVVRCVRKTDRSVDFIAAMVEDIDERKQIENELREAEWKFKALFENGPIGVAYHSMIYDETGKSVDYFFIDANENYITLTGVDPRGKTVLQAFPGIENDPFDWIGTFGKVARTGETVHFESYLKSNDRWYEVVGYQYKPDHFVASFVEITDRKRAEAAVKMIEHRQAKMIENISDVIVIIDQNGINSYKSPNVEKWFGWKPDELLGVNALDNVHPDDVVQAQESVDRLWETPNAVWTTECRYRCKDGSYKWVEISLINLIEDPEIRGILGDYHDISERKRFEDEKLLLEQQYQQTQKLESLGVLAGGIAHDFNNILAIIMGHCSLAVLDPNKAKEHIPIIQKASERAAALCRQMLAYAGQATLLSTEFNITALVDEMLKMLRTTLRQNVVINANLLEDLPSITGDASQIRQIVMNVVINAAEAIGDEQGKIDVSLAKIEIKPGQSEKDHLGISISHGWYACLEVTDNGSGMDEITQRRIFEPFYTTKFTGRGLGMSAVLGIIKAHHGALKLASQLGYGTAFKVYLPIRMTDSNANGTHIESVSEVQWQGSGTILLVEDEMQIRMVARTMLKEMGFNVLEASNGKEALELYQNTPSDIVLVLTDIGMPAMDGYTLFHELKKLDPKLPIIVSSGFGEVEVTSKLEKEDIAGMVSKPYSYVQLRDLLRVVMLR